MRTESLNVVLIPTAFHVFNHQTRLPNLGISHHANFDDDTALCLVAACLIRASLILVLIWLGVAVPVP